MKTKIKILTVVGARPQLIKAAAISRAINKYFHDKIEEIIIHTGQHYDASMSSVFFEELNIPREKYNLNIGGGTQAEQTALMMQKLEKIIIDELPDAILLYGDTNSTLAACLVASKLYIDIIHIEAGVRFYNKKYPEEINRIICDGLSTLMFVPTEDGIRALKKEGYETNPDKVKRATIDTPKIYRCGDIMYDNTLYFKEKQGHNSIFIKHNLPQENYILATLHRSFNVDDKVVLKRILEAFNHIAEHERQDIIIPLHPRTRKKIKADKELQQLIEHSRIHIIEPVSFLEMIALEQYAQLIITDSGGVQKEAYFLEKPCLILLEETAWVELLETNTALLVGSDTKKIVEGVRHFLFNRIELKFVHLYGDGKASEYICEKIIENFKQV